jgi:hypothetical protein
MAANLVENYGWKSVKGPCSCSYITPRILQLLQQLSVKRVSTLEPEMVHCSVLSGISRLPKRPRHSQQ